MRQRWAPAAGGAIGSSLALALLVCGCVFLALAGPALSLKLRTHAMHQQIASQEGPLGADLIGTASWSKFATDWSTIPLSEPVFGRAASDVAKGFDRAVPVAPGTWAGLTSSLGDAPPGFARLPIPTQLEVIYRTSLTSYTKVVAGTLDGSAVPLKDLAVSVTTQTATRFRLQPGSVVQLAGSDGLATPVTVYVTGIVRVLRPSASFWNADVLARAPVLYAPPIGQSYWLGGLFADPGQLVAMQNAFCPNPGNGINCDNGLQLRWEVPVGINAFSADQAQALQNDVSTALSGTALSSVIGSAATDITITEPLSMTIADFVYTQATINSVLMPLLVSLIAVGLAVIGLTSKLIVAQREEELRMLRARGATVSQLGRRVLAGTVLTVVPGALAGVLLALILVRLTGASLGTGWRLAIVVALITLGGPPLLTAWQHRKAEPSAVNPAVILTAETRAARFSMAAKRRMIAGGTLCACAIAILLLLRDEGMPAPGSVNWVFTIAPVLIAIPAALLAMRAYPLAVQLLLRIWHRVTATGYVALASSTRLPATLVGYTLVLTLTVAAFSGMVSGGISEGQVAASWQATGGADAQISVPGSIQLTGAEEKQIAAVPGVRHSTTVRTTDWTLPDGSPITLVAVNPAQYAALAADTPYHSIPTAALTAAGPAIPVVASPPGAALLGGHDAQVSGQLAFHGLMEIRVAGTVTSMPGQPSGSQFALIAADRMPEGGLAEASTVVLITGDVDQAKLTALVTDVLPGGTVTFRSAMLASLTRSPLVHAGAVLMTMSVAACCVLAVLSLLLGLALGARDRSQTMARLAVMGHRRDTTFMLLYVLPALLGATVAAVACTLALPILVGSSLNLSPYTSNDAIGSGTAVELRPDLLALCLPGAAILILACAISIMQTRRSRRDVPSLLRVE